MDNAVDWFVLVVAIFSLGVELLLRNEGWVRTLSPWLLVCIYVAENLYAK